MPVPPKKKCGFLAIRVTPPLLDAIDREAERRRRERPGASVSRSEVARECLFRCLKVAA